MCTVLHHCSDICFLAIWDHGLYFVYIWKFAHAQGGVNSLTYFITIYEQLQYNRGYSNAGCGWGLYSCARGRQWHHSLPLMNSFNKTEAAIFPCRLCFLGAFPFISLIYLFLRLIQRKIVLCMTFFKFINYECTINSLRHDQRQISCMHF